MKMVHLTVHFEYAERIQALLDERGVQDYALHDLAKGRDCDGKHQGSQVFPGNLACFLVLVDEDALQGVLDALRDFKERKEAHRHLRAAVLPVEDAV
jgi:hypothetical protein